MKAERELDGAVPVEPSEADASPALRLVAPAPAVEPPPLQLAPTVVLPGAARLRVRILRPRRLVS